MPTPRRDLRSYTKVQRTIGPVVRNRRWQVRQLPRSDYLNLGCGGNARAGWINVDWCWKPGVDLCWDVRRGLPLAASSMVGVYTEHMLEHFSLAEGTEILAECFRVLRPGGTIRIAVPDGALMIGRYNAGEPIDAVNHLFCEHGHRFIYDFDALERQLELVGFCSIERAAFGVGRDEQMLIDSERRAAESMYVEAAKP